MDRLPDDLCVTYINVKVGDVIVGYQIASHNYRIDYGPHTVALVSAYGVLSSASGPLYTFGYNYLIWIRSRTHQAPHRGVCAVGTAITGGKAKADSPWNGTCTRCGKGTYTGANKVEHDGTCLVK